MNKKEIKDGARQENPQVSWGEEPENLSQLLLQWGFNRERSEKFGQGNFRGILLAAYYSQEGVLEEESEKEWIQLIDESLKGSVDALEYFEKVKGLIKRKLKEGYPEEWFLGIVEVPFL